MELEALLRAHGFMRVERPPQLWEVDSELERFLPMLGEMIALGLSTSTELSELILNVSNVVVESDEDPDEDPWLEPGEYVAITLRGAGTGGRGRCVARRPRSDPWHPRQCCTARRRRGRGLCLHARARGRRFGHRDAPPARGSVGSDFRSRPVPG